MAPVFGKILSPEGPFSLCVRGTHYRIPILSLHARHSIRLFTNVPHLMCPTTPQALSHWTGKRGAKVTGLLCWKCLGQNGSPDWTPRLRPSCLQPSTHSPVPGTSALPQCRHRDDHPVDKKVWLIPVEWGPSQLRKNSWGTVQRASSHSFGETF